MTERNKALELENKQLRNQLEKFPDPATPRLEPVTVENVGGDGSGSEIAVSPMAQKAIRLFSGRTGIDWLMIETLALEFTKTNAGMKGSSWMTQVYSIFTVCYLKQVPMQKAIGYCTLRYGSHAAKMAEIYQDWKQSVDRLFSDSEPDTGREEAKKQ